MNDYTVPAAPPARRTGVRLPQISEKAFQQQVVGLARYSGFRVYHTFDSRRSEPGFPDLVMIRAPRVLFAELKAGRGKTSPAQDVWLEALSRCPGVEVYLWRPDDIDEIRRTLSHDYTDHLEEVYGR